MENTRNSISFVLDGRIVELDFKQDPAIQPTTTVLNYLRAQPNFKGTKEGCAEGDCGACTVAIGELQSDGTIRYRACDSCLIFLPMLHGKQLVTVEQVGTHDNLHPVQQAMVDTDGSQCGYCTPGFIMSLFTLYKNTNHPDRAEIIDALTGNLCRCTGYRPIVEAAAQSCVANGKDHFTTIEANTAKLLQSILEDKRSILLKNDTHQYHRPQTLAEAIQLRSTHPDALIVNGATDIGLLATKQKKQLPLMIDISGVEELKLVEDTPNALTLGAGVNLEDMKRWCEKDFPAMYDMLAVFGSRQIRNLATIGGNVANASPIGDTPPVLMAYDATVVVQGPNGERSFKARDFVTGYRTTAMEKEELITKVILPKLQNGTKVKAYKISKRKDLDISTVSSGFRLDLDQEGKVEDIVLVYGGMAAMTQRATKAEEYLKGQPWEREQVEEAMNLVETAFTPISDARASKEGRAVMARNLLLKFWSETS